ncbi:MAG: glycosyltransferase family 2 protein [Acidobacteria bacterium]|nr:glycosyltransferase family 2 protein [Acidobacteriota bacterium]
MPRLSVVIPAFNEVERIVPTLERLREYFASRPYPVEILVVDDGSLDGTTAAAAPLCRVIRYQPNRGKGYAVRRGVREARGRLVLVSDADLSTPIEEVENLLPAVEADGCALAFGSRAHPDARIEVPQGWIRERMGKVFNRIVRLLTGLPYRDTQCGFKLLARERVLPVLEECRIDRFGYDVELLCLARRRGLALAEVPVRWRNSGPSRVRMFRDSARMLLDAVRIAARHRFRR